MVHEDAIFVEGLENNTAEFLVDPALQEDEKILVELKDVRMDGGQENDTTELTENPALQYDIRAVLEQIPTFPNDDKGSESVDGKRDGEARANTSFNVMIGLEASNQSLEEFDGTCDVSEVGASGVNYRIHVEKMMCWIG